MKGHKGHHHRKARGGSVKAHEFTPNAPENKEAESRDDGFKRGGKAYKSGGRVHGHKSHHRLDKKPRGHHAMARGGGVLSAAANVKEAKKGGGKGLTDAEDD